MLRDSIVLWSRSIAVWPLTLTVTLSTVPSVAGISRSCSVVSACFEAASVPLPASGIDSTATVPVVSLVRSIGWCTAPLAIARCSRSVIAERTAISRVSSALITTVAGVSVLGNAFSTCLSTAIPGSPGGRSLMPVLCTRKCSAGDAIASRIASERAAAAAGRRSTRVSTAPQMRDS